MSASKRTGGGAERLLARLIQQETRGGKEIVELMVSVLRGWVPIPIRLAWAARQSVRNTGASRIRYVPAPLRLRIRAAVWLAERGFGKSPSVLDEVEENQQVQVDLSDLTKEEATHFLRLLEKVKVSNQRRMKSGRPKSQGDTGTV